MNSNNFDVLIKDYSSLLENLLNKEHLPFDNENLKTKLPKQGGVYCISDKTDNTIIYIGQSKNLQKRIYRNHLIGHQRNSTFRRKLVKRGKYSSEDQVKSYLHEQCMVQFVVIEKKALRAFCHRYA